MQKKKDGIQKKRYNIRDTRPTNGITFSLKILNTIIQPFTHFNFHCSNYVQFFCFINQIKNVNEKYFYFLKKGHVTTPFFLKKLNLKKLININNMGNQNTTQKQITAHFQTLKWLPTTLIHSQCVLHKHELLICGGYDQRACYSYHTLRNEYKFICEYPRDVQLHGHCVVKLVDSNSNNDKDNNQITLLSFDLIHMEKNKHTLVMKY
ncbi:hypothetical protein RFI_00626, partial [Reticulomyxa filosa]